jgi:hypothetical protein
VPEKAVLDANDIDAELHDGGLGDDADDGVEAGAVAAAGEDADAGGFPGGGGHGRGPFMQPARSGGTRG